MVANGMRDRITGLRDGFHSRLLAPARYFCEGSLMTALRRRGAKSPFRVGLVSDGAEITSEEQFNPFSAYRSTLRRQLGVISLKMPVNEVLRSPHTRLAPFDVVILKLSFRKDRSEALAIVRSIKAATSAPLIYFDGDDDLCVQWPELLPEFNLYVKKHVFRDGNEYSKPRIGKTNLTNYVHEKFGVSFDQDPIASTTDSVPADQIDKITDCTNLATDRAILGLYRRIEPRTMFESRREIDIVFRGNIPNNWMSKLRAPLRPTLERMRASHRVVTPEKRVTPRDYYRELSNSKICISPFGYGEICWRDFEAVLCGALLVKPDMGHVQTNPDIFKPLETYVPVRWDFSDLEEQCTYYLKHERERQKITKAAFDVLDQFYRNDGFVLAFSRILKQLTPP